MYFLYVSFDFFGVFFSLVLLGFFISYLMYFGSKYIAAQKYDSTKVTIYECGFDPFSDAREPFDVSFYLVALLFIIFDLEVVFFVPWAVSVCGCTGSGAFTILIFFIILGIGFMYEWVRGALDWS